MERNDSIPDPLWHSRLAAGQRAFSQRRYAEAYRHLEAAAAEAPGERDVLYWLGNAYRMTGLKERAETVFRRLLNEHPDDEEVVFALGFLLREQGRGREAGEPLLQFAGRKSTPADALLRVAGFLRDADLFEAAIEVCSRASGKEPGRADILSMLANLYQATGRFDEALACLRKALEINPGLGGAWLNLSRLLKFGDACEDDFQRMLSASRLPASEETRLCIAFALGKALDDLRRRQEAWTQFEAGNRLARLRQDWDGEAWKSFVRERVGRPPRNKAWRPGEKARAVFIVGMLRSGTTFLEQRLDRHPSISGRGELNFLARLDRQFAGDTVPPEAHRRAARQELWQQMWAEGPAEAYYVDKNPLNFRFLDTLHTLLPDARVIHVRRDGRDSCLSCFCQLFRHPDAAFSNRIDDLLDYYRGYRTLMAHWESRYPGWIHRVSYSGLVEATEQTLGQVLEFLELPWSPKIIETGFQQRAVRTASSWQARQPVYQSSLSRWPHYYELAPEFFDAIAGIDEAFS